MSWRVLAAMLVLGAGARAQAPGEVEPARLLEKARRTAVNYSQRLPDFLCTELVHRSEANGSAKVFRNTDTLTMQISYFQMHESYNLVARNNRPTKQKLESLGGATSQGEFGSILLSVFHPLSKAEFAFKEWSVVGGRGVAVFTYVVERANSHFQLRVGGRSAFAGYHGEVAIDAQTYTVLRIEQTIDVPENFPVEYSRSEGEYDFVDVGGQQYLLPVRWESWSADLPQMHRQMRTQELVPDMANQKRYHNVIEFQDYRKYAAESKLSFDGPEETPVKKR